LKYLLAFAVAWFLAVLNVSAMPYVQVLHVTPDVVLIFAACWTMVRGRDEGLIVVPIAALLRDLTTSDPLGTSLQAMAPLIPLAAVVRLRAMATDFLPTVALVAAGSFFYGVISTLVLAATGQTTPWDDAFLRVVLPAALVNSLFTPIVYLPVHWFSPGRKAWLVGSTRYTSA